jgi:hypothetical protein
LLGIYLEVERTKAGAVEGARTGVSVMRRGVTAVAAAIEK